MQPVIMHTVISEFMTSAGCAALKNSGQLAGGCAEKCSVTIMCTLLHRVSIVATSLSGLSRGKLAVNV